MENDVYRMLFIFNNGVLVMKVQKPSLHLIQYATLVIKEGQEIECKKDRFALFSQYLVTYDSKSAKERLDEFLLGMGMPLFRGDR